MNAPGDTPAGEPALAPRPHEPPAAPGSRGRILLLEDDASFREVVADFLTERGYAVVPVQNGGEGVREVLEGEFAVILCDLMMPSLAGDMFFRAVGRIRRPQCDRFIFMTGFRGDDRTNGFLDRVDGTVLRKPFHLDELLEKIAAVEARASLIERIEAERAADAAAAVMHALPAPTPVPFPSPVTGHRHPSPAPFPTPFSARTPWPARATPTPYPPLAPGTRPAPAVSYETEQEAPRRLARPLTAALITLLVVAGLHYVRFRAADQTVRRLTQRQAALQAEWTEAESRQRLAENGRRGLALLPKRAARIAAERTTIGWTDVLRAVAIAGGTKIEVRWATARRLNTARAACELELTGLAAGENPRGTVDEFRRALIRELQPAHPDLTAEITSLDDEPGGAAPRARFSLNLKPGPAVATPAP